MRQSQGTSSGIFILSVDSVDYGYNVQSVFKGLTVLFESGPCVATQAPSWYWHSGFS